MAGIMILIEGITTLVGGIFLVVDVGIPMIIGGMIGGVMGSITRATIYMMGDRTRNIFDVITMGIVQVGLIGGIVGIISGIFGKGPKEDKKYKKN